MITSGQREAQRKIANAFMRGWTMTSAEANEIGRTVDARKIISRLREDKGMPIADE